MSAPTTPVTPPQKGKPMQLSMPSGLGAIIAIIVLILAILGLFHVLPMAAEIVFGLIALLAAARLT